MPAYPTIDLIYEISIAIASNENSQFSVDTLVQLINKSRRKRGEKRKVSGESIDRILKKLWLTLGIRKTVSGVWEKGTGPIRGLTNVRPDIVERLIDDQGIRVTPAEFDRWIGLGEEPTTHKAYICYPYHDNPIKRSIELLVLLVHLYPKAKDSFVPASPHEMYWGLEERTNRAMAMSECRKLIEKCDFLLYCLRKKDTPSTGMKKDMEVAEKKGLETRYIEDILGYYPNLQEILIRCGLSEFAEIPRAVSISR